MGQPYEKRADAPASRGNPRIFHTQEGCCSLTKKGASHTNSRAEKMGQKRSLNRFYARQALLSKNVHSIFLPKESDKRGHPTLKPGQIQCQELIHEIK